MVPRSRIHASLATRHLATPTTWTTVGSPQPRNPSRTPPGSVHLAVAKRRSRPVASKVQLLPKEIGSISRWVPADAERDTLCVMGANGGMSVTPDANFTVVFGRNEEHVNVGIGGDDKYVSRRQGMITREYSCWGLSNTG